MRPEDRVYVHTESNGSYRAWVCSRITVIEGIKIMARPKGKLFALLAIFAAIGLVTATGAFTSVQADRTATVDVAGDSSALLGITKYSGSGSTANADEYVSTTVDDTIQIEVASDDGGSGVNIDAETDIANLLVLTNQGSQAVGVYITVTDEASDEPSSSTSGESGMVTFYNTTFGATADGSIQGTANAVKLDPGESLVVGMKLNVDSSLSADDDIIDEITIIADASLASSANQGPNG